MITSHSSLRKLLQRRKRGATHPGNVGQPPVVALLPSKDESHYLAGIFPILKATGTQHVLGDQRHNIGARSPLDQLDVDFVQPLTHTLHRN